MHLKNALFYPSQNRKSSFSSATASSQAKKRRVLIPPTHKSKPRKLPISKPRGFVSHYDQLKQDRKTKTLQSMIKLQRNLDQNNENNKNIIKTESKSFIKPIKKDLNQSKTTIPKAQNFATSNRMQNRRELRIQQREEQRESNQLERLERIKKEKIESEKRLKAMRRRMKKRHQIYHTSSTSISSKPVKRNRNRSTTLINKDKDKTGQRLASVKSAKAMKRSRSQPHFMKDTKSKALRVRARSFKIDNDPSHVSTEKEKTNNNLDSIRGERILRSSSVIRKNMNHNESNHDLDEGLIKEFSEMKEKLRFAKQISIPRSRSLERIQSRYAQRKDNETRSRFNLRKKRCGINVTIPSLPTLQTENDDMRILKDIEQREREMNNKVY